MYSLAPMPSNAGHLVVRQVRASHLEAPARMREADDRALRLRPLQDRQVQLGQSSIRVVPG